MSKIEVKLLICLIVIPLILSTPAHSFKVKDPCIIYGCVKNQNGQIISNASITVVDNQTGQIKNTKSDEHGKFSVILDDYELGDQIHITASDGENTAEIIFTLNNPVANRIDVVINQPTHYQEYAILTGILTGIAISGGLLYFLLKKRRGNK